MEVSKNEKEISLTYQCKAPYRGEEEVLWQSINTLTVKTSLPLTSYHNSFICENVHIIGRLFSFSVKMIEELLLKKQISLAKELNAYNEKVVQLIPVSRIKEWQCLLRK